MLSYYCTGRGEGETREGGKGETGEAGEAKNRDEGAEGDISETDQVEKGAYENRLSVIDDLGACVVRYALCCFDIPYSHCRRPLVLYSVDLGALGVDFLFYAIHLCFACCFFRGCFYFVSGKIIVYCIDYEYYTECYYSAPKNIL